MDGQTTIFDELNEKPSAPPYRVTTQATARHPCGWCGTKNTIGGGAGRMPGDDTTGCYYAYCTKCLGLYGSPKIWELQLIVETPEINPVEEAHRVEIQKHLRGEK